MYVERPGSPAATIVAPTSNRRSTSIETRRSRLASERPPKKGVATKNAFRSGELTAISQIYSRSRKLTAPYCFRASKKICRARHVCFAASAHFRLCDHVGAYTIEQLEQMN